jgi:hypothetical protein
MPNWCSNIVYLSHENKSIMKKLQECLNSEDTPLLNFLKPVGSGPHTSSGGTVGVPAERHWMKSYWGTKWEVDVDEIYIDDGEVRVGFGSASTPPIEAYNNAVENGWNIRSTFIESGDELYGVYENGHYILYKVEDDDIPDDLRSMMIDYGLIQEESEEDSEEDSE